MLQCNVPGPGRTDASAQAQYCSEESRAMVKQSGSCEVEQCRAAGHRDRTCAGQLLVASTDRDGTAAALKET